MKLDRKGVLMDKQNELKELALGALLHDVGKAIQRSGGYSGTHAKIGLDWLKSQTKLGQVKAIGDCIAYHHEKELKKTKLADNNLAYIVCEADNIASGTDRRDADMEGDMASGTFNSAQALESIFDYLKGVPKEDNRKFFYIRGLAEEDAYISYGKKKAEANVIADKAAYQEIVKQLTDNFKGWSFDELSIDEVLHVIEALFSYIPSSTDTKQIPDISLYDHVKITAALADSMYLYCQEQGIINYRDCYLKNKQDSRQETSFRLLSGDISGIQQFIYNIADKGALKSLRARSFYLDMVSEHIADILLQNLGLNRCHLLYNGGGHFYILAPNCSYVVDRLTQCETEINQWFLSNTDARLYIAMDSLPVKAADLMESEENRLGQCMRELSELVSKKKSHRYTDEQLIQLFDPQSQVNKLIDSERECSVCHTSQRDLQPRDDGSDGYVCQLCNGLIRLGQLITKEEKNVYVIQTEDKNGQGLPLPACLSNAGSGLDKPESFYLCLYTEAEYKALADGEDKHIIYRVYTKNAQFTGRHTATHIWIGDYAAKENGQSIDFASLAEKSAGIPRLGVLRADIDNLGSTFATAFSDEPTGKTKYTLSRMATLSRQLTLFFKYYINLLCQGIVNDEYEPVQEVMSLIKDKSLVNRVSIVYSGGDDVFVLGAWDAVLSFAVVLQEAFRRYTDGQLTMSAGFTMLPNGTPVPYMANMAGDFEDKSKDVVGKNSITLFKELGNTKCSVEGAYYHTFDWLSFEQEVIGEKLRFIQNHITMQEEETDKFFIGKGQLYQLVDFLRVKLNIGIGNQKTYRSINARFLYWLARLAPSARSHKNSQVEEAYQQIKRQLYAWVVEDTGDNTNCKQLLTALIFYVYSMRQTRN